MSEDTLWETQKSIEYTIVEVEKRGWQDVSLDIDEFAILREDRRVRETLTTALYEEYFLPERHEFEWQVLHDIVRAITSAPTVEFVVVAVVGGVIGNAAYDVLKKMCAYAATQFEEKLGEKGRRRAEGFKQIAEDAESLKSFFRDTPKARIEEIEQTIGIPRERIYPLLKLAGFNHYRRGTPCYWEVPH